MAGDLRRVLRDGTTRPRKDDRDSRNAGRNDDGVDEGAPVRARALQRIRVAGAGNLDRAGRDPGCLSWHDHTDARIDSDSMRRKRRMLNPRLWFAVIAFLSASL